MKRAALIALIVILAVFWVVYAWLVFGAVTA